MTPWTSDAITLAFAVLGALVVPVVGMRMLMPTLEASESAVTNYRGRRVVYGLGLVWVFWVIGVQVFGGVLDLAANRFWAAWIFMPSATGFMLLAQPVLVLGVATLGFADDMFGTAADRGFRGHLAALRTGRLTTGGLKLFGVGLLAAAVTLPRAIAAPSEMSPLSTAGVWVLETLAIALSANFVNLTDLRPGRALKVYSAIGVVLALAPALWGAYGTIGIAFVLLLGPVVAVWPYDLGGRAMLGDAGANAAGALLGWVAVVTLPTAWMLALYVAIMLAFNLASERISFSRVIAGNRLLSWLDGLGRPSGERPGQETVATQE
jgi:UDP-N-acetylmuramyl pentapeptide phosphotransferase/UDP-N-acetylglucosamine-1-phosphate transferase